MRKSEAFDAFQRQAFTLLTGPRRGGRSTSTAKTPELRDRYGRNTWGQRCLLARRLVEAGVDLVTTSLDGPLCGRVGNWDDHAVNHHVFDAMKAALPLLRPGRQRLDRGHPRPRPRPPRAGGRHRRVRPHAEDQLRQGLGLGRGRSPAATTGPAPSRCCSAAGASTGGQVIGATDRHGADVTRRRVGVRDFLATIYHHLGIDAASLTLRDRTGRPVAALPDGQPIPELTAT